MANHYSPIKRARQGERRTAINRARKTRLRHTMRALRRKLEANDVKAAEALLPETFSAIDRAAKWGVIKDNTADRFKSRLNARLKKLSA